jgi:hypothetical protein
VIGGALYSQSAETKVAGLEVEIVGTGLYTRTDSAGRFRFTGLQTGAFQLVVYRADGSSVPKSITLPPRPHESYDVEI